MFDLYDKRTGKLTKIYSVQEDSHGYPKFLIRDSNKWLWQSAKHYITKDEYNLMDYNTYEKDFLMKYIINNCCNKF